MCVRVPSFHVSQWRNNSRSAILPLTVASPRVLRVFSRHAVSVQSGKTSDAITNHLPSGDQEKEFTPVGNVVALTGSPPERSSFQICGSPSRSERNARVRPSGEKRGSKSLLSPEVSRRGSPPDAATIQMLERDVFAATSGIETV